MGMRALFYNTTGANNSAMGMNALYDLNITANDGSGNNTAVGYNTGRGIVTGVNNTIIGANVTGLASTLSNTVIIADGSGNQRIYVDSGGNVGIGTTTPTNRLDVVGRVRVTAPYSPHGDNYYAYLTANYGADYVFELGVNSHPLITTGVGEYNSGANLLFWTSDTVKMAILSSGNVGIGTTTPGYALEVNGTFKANTTAPVFGAYTLTVPATGTAALLGIINTFAYTDAAGTTDYGYASQITLTRTIADSGGIKNSIALNVVSNYTDTGTYYAPKAIRATIYNSSTGTITEATALMGFINNTTTGTITTARGLYTFIQNSSTGTITTAQGIFIAGPHNNGGGVLTNAYGLYIEAITAGSTLNYALYTAGGRVHLGSLPTSSAGLATGDLYVAAGVLMVA
jgi:hypothetical protein